MRFIARGGIGRAEQLANGSVLRVGVSTVFMRVRLSRAMEAGLVVTRQLPAAATTCRTAAAGLAAPIRRALSSPTWPPSAWRRASGVTWTSVDVNRKHRAQFAELVSNLDKAAWLALAVHKVSTRPVDAMVPERARANGCGSRKPSQPAPSRPPPSRPQPDAGAAAQPEHR